MKFGVLYEIHTPRPWHENTDYERYWECIDEIKTAEAVGFDEVWGVEHHFTEEFAHLSAPEVFLTAVAQHTTTMRIGHGVVLLPRQYNHAVRVAERAAALDILCRGRLDFGTGRSSTTLDMMGFEIDPEETRPQWEESIQMIPRFWTEERVSFKGKFYDIPKRTVLPKPYQKPHPPIWMAGAQPSSIDLAAKYGLGFLHMTLLDPEQSWSFINDYKDKIRRAEPVAGLVTNQFGAFTLGYCSEDEREVLEVAAPGAFYYATERTRVHKSWQRRFGSVPESYRFHHEHGSQIDFESPDAPSGLFKLGTMAVGTPDKVMEVVKTYEQAGADQLILYMELPYLKHDQIKRSIQTFGEKVIQPYKAALAKKEIAAAHAH